MYRSRRQLLGSDYFGRTVSSTHIDARTRYDPSLPSDWCIVPYGPGHISNEKEQEQGGSNLCYTCTSTSIKQVPGEGMFFH